MYRLSAVIGGIVAGSVGAGIWAIVAYFTGFEIGWLAWGIGLLVGIGVTIGNKGEGSVSAGVLAAALAVLAVVGGKYTMVRMVMPNESELVTSSLAALEDDEIVVSYLADAIVEEYEVSGKAVQWPEGSQPFQGTVEQDYPADIWAAAATRWEAMSEAEQESFRSELSSNIEASAAAFQDMIANAGFLHTFGLMDLIFFTLAVVTAFKIGKKGSPLEHEAYA